MKKKLPKILMLNITEKCNSQCVMCGTWRKRSSAELSLEQLLGFCEKNKRYLREVETVGLIGGEPFLATNYLNFIKAVIKYFPKVKTIGQATNSLAPEAYLKKVKAALKIIPKNVFYGVSVSLDGVGPVHDAVRGVPGAFLKASRFIERAEKLFSKNDNFYLTVTTTLSKVNLKETDKIIDFARQTRVRFNFRPAMSVASSYIDNSQISGWQPAAADEKILQREFRDLYQVTRNPYYDFISELFNGKKRKFPCPFQSEGFVINPDGKVFMCLFSDRGYLGDYSDPLISLFGSSAYSKTSQILKQEVCGTCSAECYTSRSSTFKDLDFLEQQLIKLLGGRTKDLKKATGKASRYMFNQLLRDIADFKSGQLKIKRSPLTDEEKIIYNTWLGRKKYLIGVKQRGGLKLDFEARSLGSLLLNLAKYYYFIKIYSRSQSYLNMVNRFFRSEPQLISSAKKIENKMKLL